MKFFLYVLTFISIVFTNTVYGQLTDTAGKWNMQECIQYAAAHNIQISTLRLDEAYARQNLYLSNGARFPSLNGSVGNVFNNANNAALGNSLLVNQTNSIGTYAIEAAIVLWN